MGLIEYLSSEAFLKGFATELLGLTVEIILLSILIPLVWLLVKYYRNKPIKLTFYIYACGAFDGVLRAILCMFSVKTSLQRGELLVKESVSLKEDYRFQGALSENIRSYISAIKKMLKDRSLVKKLDAKPMEHFIECRDMVSDSLKDLDQAAFMAIPFPKLHMELFNIRSIVFGLKKTLDSMEESDISRILPFRFISHLKSSVLAIEHILNEQIRPLEKYYIRREKRKVIVWLIKMFPKGLLEILIHPGSHFGSKKYRKRRRRLVNKFKKQKDINCVQSVEMFFNLYEAYEKEITMYFRQLDESDFNSSFNQRIQQYRPEARKSFLEKLVQYGLIQSLEKVSIDIDLQKIIVSFMEFIEKDEAKRWPPSSLPF